MRPNSAAHGPFLWLVWFHRRASAAAAMEKADNVNMFGESTPPGKSAVSFYHITTGKGRAVQVDTRSTPGKLCLASSLEIEL